MGIADLPVELVDDILDRIVRFQPTPRLSQYATISRTWQAIVERRTFQVIQISSTELEKHERLLRANPHVRGNALESIKFVIVLPGDVALDYTPSRQIADSRGFTKAVQRPFAVLAVYNRLLSLVIQVSDHTWWQYPDRYRHTYLNLLPSHDLPVLPRVRAIEINADYRDILSKGKYRHIHPASVSTTCKKLPRVVEISCGLNDDVESSSQVNRAMTRKGFGLSFGQTNFEMGKILYLRYAHTSLSNQLLTGLDVRDPLDPDGPDPLSHSLGLFISTSNITEIYLYGPICITNSVFGNCVEGKETNLWPAVTILTIFLSPQRPDGGWYFDPPPDFPPELLATAERHRQDGDEVENVEPFRTQPNGHLMQFLETAAIAASDMTRLEAMRIAIVSTDQYEGSRVMLELEYRLSHVPSMLHQSEAEACKTDAGRHLHLDVPEGWVMSERLDSLWRELLDDHQCVTYLPPEVLYGV